MKIIEQISTGNIVARFAPHNIHSLGNASIETGIDVADLREADEALTEQGYIDRLGSELSYAENRRQDYPSIGEQLDDIYHNGIEGWKATIKLTKDKYPKY